MFEDFADTTDLYWGYLWTVVVANLIYVIFSIIGAVKARRGQFYYFVFFGRLAYHMTYRIKENEGEQAIENRPPI